MKKVFKIMLLLLVVFGTATYPASKIKNFFKSKKARTLKYNDIRVTFITTQGEVNFYLYPEAAPITVANFINLGKRGFYNNNKIHRAIDNFVVQAGDPTGTGRGGPGYTIPDEIVEWLDFFQQGMLAMANAGPDTGGSQYFMTVYPAEWLNGKHTVFGEYVSDQDFEVIKKLEYGDIIKEVKFSSNADQYLSLHKAQIDKWNAALDKEYPNLKKYPVRAATAGAMSAYKAELANIYADKKKDERNYKEFFIPKAIRKVDNALSGKNKEKTEDGITVNSQEPATSAANSAEAEKLNEMRSDLEKMEADLQEMKKQPETVE